MPEMRKLCGWLRNIERIADGMAEWRALAERPAQHFYQMGRIEAGLGMLLVEVLRNDRSRGSAR